MVGIETPLYHQGGVVEIDSGGLRIDGGRLVLTS
jgi:hypothetical protein